MALTIKVKLHSHFTIDCPDGNQLRVDISGIYGDQVVCSVKAPLEYIILREGVVDDRTKASGRKGESITGDRPIDRKSGQGGY